MTDRELLEIAAKAAGIKALRDPYGFLRNCTGCDPAQNIFAAPAWNPLTDDGDALRLMVGLGLRVDVLRPDILIVDRQGRSTFHNNQSGDPYAATRRAIVRAAAEIGKAVA